MDTTKFLVLIAILISGVTGYYTYKMSEDIEQLNEQVRLAELKLDELMSAAEQESDKAAQERQEGVTKSEHGYDMEVTASYRLEDRYVRFEVELPKVISTQEGQVVVNITVDEMGVVKKTSIGKGTTLTDEDVLEAARKAALRTGFNISIGAARQTGTITYKYEEIKVIRLQLS